MFFLLCVSLASGILIANNGPWLKPAYDVGDRMFNSPFNDMLDSSMRLYTDVTFNRDDAFVVYTTERGGPGGYSEQISYGLVTCGTPGGTPELQQYIGIQIDDWVFMLEPFEYEWKFCDSYSSKGRQDSPKASFYAADQVWQIGAVRGSTHYTFRGDIWSNKGPDYILALFVTRVVDKFWLPLRFGADTDFVYSYIFPYKLYTYIH